MTKAKKNLDSMSEETKEKSTTDHNSAENVLLRYDDYWLRKGRSIVDNSAEALSKRLKTLDNFLNYLAGGTFVGSVALTTYLQSSNIGVYGLVAIPLIFIHLPLYFGYYYIGSGNGNGMSNCIF